MKKINDALIIKEKWLNLIFEGVKTWEIRGSNTTKRGKIYLIQSGSKQIFGECELHSSHELDLHSFINNVDKHQIHNCIKLPYKKTFAWELSNPVKYKKTIPYNHPKGAIIWVKIGEKQ